MGPEISVSADGRTVSVTIPFKVRKRGGRKLILAPDGGTFIPGRPLIDSTLVKALARAFRWRAMLESASIATVEEIATAEKINASYVSRILRLTLLSPDIVEMILEGRQPADLTMATLMKPFPVEWPAQREILLGSRDH